MNMIKSWKSARKRKTIMRKFKNVCWILHEDGMGVQDRHNIFCDCVTQAQSESIKIDPKNPDKKQISNLRAQELFIVKAINDNFELFKGKRI